MTQTTGEMAASSAQTTDAVQSDAVAPGTEESAEGAYVQTARSTPTRHPERATYERAAIHAVIDEALVCHVGFIRDGAPVVLPTVHARRGDTLYIHGSSGGRFALLDGEPVGVTITLIDGLVLARSWLHHSAPSRSVVIHGTAREVTEEAEKIAAMASLIDHVAHGRSADSRPPTRKELAKTAILAIDLAEVSLKARDHSLSEEPGDEELPHWAGIIPLKLTAGAPIPDANLAEGVALPDYLIEYSRG